MQFQFFYMRQKSDGKLAKEDNVSVCIQGVFYHLHVPLQMHCGQSICLWAALFSQVTAKWHIIISSLFLLLSAVSCCFLLCCFYPVPSNFWWNLSPSIILPLCEGALDESVHSLKKKKKTHSALPVFIFFFFFLSQIHRNHRRYKFVPARKPFNQFKSSLFGVCWCGGCHPMLCHPRLAADNALLSIKFTWVKSRTSSLTWEWVKEGLYGEADEW